MTLHEVKSYYGANPGMAWTFYSESDILVYSKGGFHDEIKVQIDATLSIDGCKLRGSANKENNLVTILGIFDLSKLPEAERRSLFRNLKELIDSVIGKDKLAFISFIPPRKYYSYKDIVSEI